MAVEKILARESFSTFEINTGTEASPTWVPILGLTSVAPGSDATRVDQATFDSAGWAEHRVAGRSRTLTLEGFYEEDPQTGDRDPGQSALIDQGDLMGFESPTQFRITTLGGNLLVFTATVDVTWGGGGVNDNAGLSGNLTVIGQPQFTPAP